MTDRDDPRRRAGRVMPGSEDSRTEARLATD
jgi:hypothetical protein